jgi:hypothetical protein
MGRVSRHRESWLRLAIVAAGTFGGGCNAIFGIHQGTPPPPCYDPGPSPLLIDDMEDGVGDICNLGGRHGYWYVVGDGNEGTTDPAQGTAFEPTMIPGGRPTVLPGGPSTSHYAAHVKGSGFTGWGAFMGLNLDTEALSNQPYNASLAAGITFAIKNDVPVWVEFPTLDTVLQKNGGNCVPSATNHNCNSHFSFYISTPNTDWAQYSVPFAALTQPYGGTANWNPQQLLGLNFNVGPGAPFEVWVDDISFYYCSTGQCLPTCNDPDFPQSCPEGDTYPAACRSAAIDCAAAATWCSDPLLIDDMEDGNNLICNSGGRNGSWFTYADGTEGTLVPAQGATFTMSPIPGGRGASQMAAHMTASGFTNYAGMGLSLSASGPYDAHATAGISFWMKTSAPIVEVGFPLSATSPVSLGGLCSDTATTNNCNNSFGFFITSPHTDWFQYRVPYSALSQPGYKPDANGNSVVGSATWDPTSLNDITFTVVPPTNADLWIDDLSFYDDCSGDTCLPTCTDPNAPVACPALGASLAACWPAGTDCSTVPTRSLWGSNLASVWGSGPADVWAVGAIVEGVPATASPTLLHWDGTVWSSAASGTTHPLWGVWSGSADDTWVVGDFGTLEHWDGTAWSASSAGLTDSFNSVWGSGPTDVWAVSWTGVLVHWDGSLWSIVPGVSSSDLYHLWGSGPTDIWAVGDAGTIVHWNGTAWSTIASGTTSALWGVWGSSPNDVYAVGNTTTGEATVVHWNGAAWSTVATPAEAYPNSVWGSSPDDVWVVGQSILHFDGASWSAIANPTGQYLTTVWGTGPSDAWIVGGGGTILHWDGSAWSAVATGSIH